jgi:hypothetical protein
MATREEQRRQLQAALQALDDDDDGSDEIEYEYEGKRVRGQYRRVGPMMEALGFKLRPEQITEVEPDEPEPKGKGKGADDTVKRFAGRRIS